jgi:predicted branched-subunit amino acid permease
MPFPRWITGLLVLAALALVPWTLWLTFSLPSKHVAHHYDVAWVGFDIALGAMFGLTARAAVRRSELLAPVAAATAAMLVCDAWFDVVTSTLCAFIAYDVERAHASVARLRRRR